MFENVATNMAGWILRNFVVNVNVANRAGRHWATIAKYTVL
jgi:hypothetical protein